MYIDFDQDIQCILTHFKLTVEIWYKGKWIAIVCQHVVMATGKYWFYLLTSRNHMFKCN